MEHRAKLNILYVSMQFMGPDDWMKPAASAGPESRRVLRSGPRALSFVEIGAGPGSSPGSSGHGVPSHTHGRQPRPARKFEKMDKFVSCLLLITPNVELCVAPYTSHHWPTGLPSPLISQHSSVAGRLLPSPNLILLHPIQDALPLKTAHCHLEKSPLLHSTSPSALHYRHVRHVEIKLEVERIHRLYL